MQTKQMRHNDNQFTAEVLVDLILLIKSEQSQARSMIPVFKLGQANNILILVPYLHTDMRYKFAHVNPATTTQTIIRRKPFSMIWICKGWWMNMNINY